jgi:hypothetical protein
LERTTRPWNCSRIWRKRFKNWKKFRAEHLVACRREDETEDDNANNEETFDESDMETEIKITR